MTYLQVSDPFNAYISKRANQELFPGLENNEFFGDFSRRDGALMIYMREIVMTSEKARSAGVVLGQPCEWEEGFYHVGRSYWAMTEDGLFDEVVGETPDDAAATILAIENGLGITYNIAFSPYWEVFEEGTQVSQRDLTPKERRELSVAFRRTLDQQLHL